MNKEIRLYNILFPIWFFWILPTPALLIILLANFAVDSLVLYLAARTGGIEGRMPLWKKSIWRVWIIGFLSDLAGAALILGIWIMMERVFRVSWALGLFPATTLLSLPGVALAGVLIYFLNKRFSFTKCGLDPAHVHRLSLALAVFTAPYAMMIPLYG